jgi:hypothetical protein
MNFEVLSKLKLLDGITEHATTALFWVDHSGIAGLILCLMKQYINHHFVMATSSK